MNTINRYKASIIIFIIVCLWGGFYDFTVAFFGCVFSAILLVLGKKNKSLLIPKSIVTYGLMILLLCSVVSVLTAIDKGAAVLGVMRCFVTLFFWILWNNLSGITREQLYNAIPGVGSLATLIAFVAYFIPSLQEYFYRADRLGGFFQYSNTYAVFLLICFLIIYVKREWTKFDVAELVILLLGILFTGSRSVFVLAILAVGAATAIGKTKRKNKLLIVFGGIILAVVMQFVFNLDLERLVKLSLDSSTLNGRFLYWQDAVSVIVKNPLGLGYMGYYYYQPQFQTGNYETMFVHNGILQTALDMGIVAMAAVLVIVISNIISKKNSSLNRGMLLLLLLHTAFDFDMQYSVMIYLALMFMRRADMECYEISFKTFQIPDFVVCTICLFFSVALGMGHFGMYEWSLKLYPWNTQLLEEQMLTDSTTGKENAARIIKENGCLASAYDVSMQIALSEGDYEIAIEYGNEMLKCAGYNAEYYNRAIYYLSYALEDAVNSGETQTAQKILDAITNVPEIIEAKERKATPLAYRINDKPEIELAEEIDTYVKKIKTDL